MGLLRPRRGLRLHRRGRLTRPKSTDRQGLPPASGRNPCVSRSGDSATRRRPGSRSHEPSFTLSGSAFSYRNQRPSRVMPTGTRSYLLWSAFFRIEEADRQEMLCSFDRPPNKTASFNIEFQTLFYIFTQYLLYDKTGWNTNTLHKNYSENWPISQALLVHPAAGL